MPSRAELRLALLAALGAPVQGAGIEMTLTTGDPAGGAPRADTSVELAVDIRNAGGGYPLRGLHPSAWIRPRPGPEPTPPEDCVEVARGFSGKGALPTGVTDLNGFTVVTANADNTLAVADPSLDLATANLLLVEPIGEPVRDLAIDDAGAAAYLSLSSGIARVDLEDGRRITLALDGSPGEILRDLRTGALWVALDAAGAVTRLGGSGVAVAVETKEAGEADVGDARIDVGPGPIRLVLDSDGERVFALAADGQLTAIDAIGPTVVWRARTKGRPAALAYSALADTVYVAVGARHGGKLMPFAADTGRALAPIALPGAADMLAVGAAGRILLTLDRSSGLVGIVDLARARVLQALEFINAPDDLVLTGDYAYVHHTAAPRVSLIALKGLERNREAAVIDVPFGTTAPGLGPAMAKPTAVTASLAGTRSEAAADSVPANIAEVAPLVAAIPHGGGAVVVNAGDRMAFVYMEDGMLAPMNAFRLKAGEPQRVAVRDRRLLELGDGRYVTTARVGPAGDYELIVALAAPPVVNCLPFGVAGTRGAGPDRAGAATTVARLIGEPTRDADLIVALADAAGSPLTNVRDLQFLIMKPDGRWHRRGFARPDEPGQYRLGVRLPERGRYNVLLSSASLGLTFEQIGGLHATVED
ncbi:PQQ-binding-like beta-propeller repeat protein [Thiocapsa sp.]|uniref:outer membrane protein assembly factor BamB family protein n=1 Tax=Thiocapsa sp. TaxID=2024551 RepID=UPI0025DB2B2C|nr:PQQ-binding-like beta-propeller repeat protein [Thiocapsa sp.]